jgi:hypothetical protein
MTNKAFLVECPNLENLVYIEAEDASDAAENAASMFCEVDLAEGEYRVYALQLDEDGTALLINGVAFNIDENGEHTD